MVVDTSEECAGVIESGPIRPKLVAPIIVLMAEVMIRSRARLN